MRDEKELLLDILDAIEKIEKYSTKGEDAFYADELVQVWIIHYAQIIGEAASKISPSFRKLHSEIEWAQITAMRNVLVHQYFGIDLMEVWDTAIRDIPILKAKIIEILEEISKGS